MPELNNDKNVYLIGAGLSKEIGLPLQDDFLLVAREVFFRDPTLFKHFERVFDYQDKLTKMKKYLNYPLLNLEHLFNLFEMDVFYSNSPELADIKNDFIRLVCDVLIAKTPCPFYLHEDGHLRMDNRFQAYVSFISILVKDYQDDLIMHGDTVISFNYDLVLEAAACIYNYKRHESRRGGYRKGNIRFNTTFGKTNITLAPFSNCFAQNRTGLDFPNSDLFSGDDGAIKLIKLHGSINWKATNGGETFIVPPTWNKSDPQIRNLWDYAYKELKSARRIVVIGYSFPETDIYVKSLIALALNENKILQNIYFINPDEDVAKKMYLSLLDKYFEKYCAYKPWRFSYFVDSEEGRKFIEESLNRQVSA